MSIAVNIISLHFPRNTGCISTIKGTYAVKQTTVCIHRGHTNPYHEQKTGTVCFSHMQKTHLRDNISHRSTHSASSSSSRRPLAHPNPSAATCPHQFTSLISSLSLFLLIIPLFLPPSCETVSSVCSRHKPQHDTVTPAITSPAAFY